MNLNIILLISSGNSNRYSCIYDELNVWFDLSLSKSILNLILFLQHLNKRSPQIDILHVFQHFDNSDGNIGGILTKLANDKWDVCVESKKMAFQSVCNCFCIQRCMDDDCGHVWFINQMDSLWESSELTYISIENKYFSYKKCTNWYWWQI